MRKNLKKYSVRRVRTVKNGLPRFAMPWQSLIIVSAILFICFSCHKNKGENIVESDILVKMDEEVLTRDEVVMQIPVGLSHSDSVALSRKIIDTWVRNHVLESFAEEKIENLDEINRLVDNYRTRLIVLEYLSQMSNGKINDNPEDSIKKYYARYHKELITQTPLLKGLFIKLDDKNKALPTIRELVKSATDESVDSLENYYIDNVQAYSYFADRWVEWENLADNIPYRFGDPDKFLEENKFFETSYKGNTYLLNIFSYLPSGSEQPYEYASKNISELLNRISTVEFEDRLVAELIEKAQKENRLVGVGYDSGDAKNNLKKDRK